MFSVAIIGPDGAGKTTVCKEIERHAALPVKYIYMGGNLADSNIVSPLWKPLIALKRLRGKNRSMGAPPKLAGNKARTGGMGPKRVFQEIKSVIRVLLLMSDEWWRWLAVNKHVRRGTIVVMDRHFYADYYCHDIKVEHSLWSRRFHGRMLERFYPRPNLTILLDAPAEILATRKCDGTQAEIESRRNEYLQFAEETEHVHLVDASRPFDEVVGSVAAIIRDKTAEPGRAAPQIAVPTSR